VRALILEYIHITLTYGSPQLTLCRELELYRHLQTRCSQSLRNSTASRQYAPLPQGQQPRVLLLHAACGQGRRRRYDHCRQTRPAVQLTRSTVSMFGRQVGFTRLRRANQRDYSTCFNASDFGTQRLSHATRFTRLVEQCDLSWSTRVRSYLWRDKSLKGTDICAVCESYYLGRFTRCASKA
jgi:hypothetical protein